MENAIKYTFLEGDRMGWVEIGWDGMGWDGMECRGVFQPAIGIKGTIHIWDRQVHGAGTPKQLHMRDRAVIALASLWISQISLRVLLELPGPSIP